MMAGSGREELGSTAAVHLEGTVLKYKQIQNYVASELDVQASSVKTCWIAEVKRQFGLTQRRASNAGQGKGAPPCPPRYRRAIARCIGGVLPSTDVTKP